MIDKEKTVNSLIN